MPTFIFWKTLSLTVLTLQTVKGDSNFLNRIGSSSFSVNTGDQSGLVGSPIADGGSSSSSSSSSIIIEAWQQQVPDLQSDPNLLVVNEKDFCPSASNQIQSPGRAGRARRARRRRSRLKREESMCASDLNPNAKAPPNDRQEAPDGERTGSTAKSRTEADPLQIPSRWLDLPKDPTLCGVDTGLAKLPVCHLGFPRAESPAWWLENIRPSMPGSGCLRIEDLWCCLYVQLRTDILAISDLQYPAAGSNCVKVDGNVPLRRPL